MVSSQSQREASAKWKKVHREQYNAAQKRRAMNRYQNDEEYRERKKEQQRIYQKERYYRKKAEALALKATSEGGDVLCKLQAE